MQRVKILLHEHILQMKKCTTCWYCTMLSVRMADEEFSCLHWLPDPTFGPEKELQPFDQLYGHDTTDCNRPSQQDKPTNTPADKENSHILVAGMWRPLADNAENTQNTCILNDTVFKLYFQRAWLCRGLLYLELVVNDHPGICVFW